MAEVLETFFDEGGTHAGARRLSVAGYFGIHEQWVDFLEQWGNPEFHAKRPESEALKPKMIEVLEHCGLTGIACTVEPQKYKELAGAVFQSAIGNAYAVCTFACVLGLNSAFPDEKFSFVIEDGQPNSEWVLRMILAMQNSAKWGHAIAGAMLARKPDFVQLQAADFIAHSYASQHPRWLPEIKKLDPLDVDFGTEKLIALAEEVKRIVAEHRNQKRKARRAARDAKQI